MKNDSRKVPPMNHASENPGSPGKESTPASRIEQPLLDALKELRAACAETAPLNKPYRHPRGQLTLARQAFEQSVILPAYWSVQIELRALMTRWSVGAYRLPEFQGGRCTAQLIQESCKCLTREFDPRCSLQAAVRASCLIWTLRHVGYELLGSAWSGHFSWSDADLGPQCYSDSSPFPNDLWELAAGRQATEKGLAKVLVRFIPECFIDDPAWRRRVLQGEEEELRDAYVGTMPFLPLATWASATRPEGLEAQVRETLERLDSARDDYGNDLLEALLAG
jgi:hypothetical protein